MSDGDQECAGTVFAERGEGERRGRTPGTVESAGAALAQRGEQVAKSVAVLDEWNEIAEMIERWRRSRSHGHPPMSIVQIRRFRRDPSTKARSAAYLEDG